MSEVPAFFVPLPLTHQPFPYDTFSHYRYVISVRLTFETHPLVMIIQILTRTFNKIRSNFILLSVY